MVNVALFVRLEAKPGKEEEVESFLRSGLAIVEEEPATTAWFGPLNPNLMETWPEAKLISEDGMKKGDSLRGPFSCTRTEPS